MEFKGIGASSGIAIAKAYKLETDNIHIEKQSIIDINKEFKKLEDALKVSIADIKKLFTVTNKKIGSDKAQIFLAHQEIINDPVFITDIKQLITNEKVDSAYATDIIANQYINQFKAMADDYFRERASDIADVTNRLIKHLLGIKIQDLATIDEEVIIVGHDLTPSQTAQLDPLYVKGFLCDVGGRTSHAAIMARSLEIPAVLGLNDITKRANSDDVIIMDGNSGQVIIKPSKLELEHWQAEQTKYETYLTSLEQYKNTKTITLDGHQVELEGNIGSLQDVASVIDHGGVGVGLFRSEFLYMNNDHWPTEEQQYNAYKSVLDAMPNDLVVIRTLDIGGDKHLSYFNFPKEDNPFLGYRAIRLSLDKIAIFKTQIRALLRASVFGKLAIMFPMITTVDEFIKAKAIVLECKADLQKENIAVNDDLQIGMMVEVPSAAVIADIFSRYADFISIGTNDLIQYSNAVDRMSQNVAYLYQPYSPAILRLIKMTIDGTKKNNKWIGMCGELAGEILAAPLLIGMGLDYFSMSATSILKIRKIINNLDKVECESLVSEVLEYNTEDEVKIRVQQFLQEKNLL